MMGDRSDPSGIDDLPNGPVPGQESDVGRTWTLDEARDALPEVRRMLQVARDAAMSLQAASSIPERRARHAVLQEAVAAFSAKGILVKDLGLGLVDFPSLLGDQIVELCWRDGEPDIGHWHPVGAGFGGRRPIPTVEATAP